MNTQPVALLLAGAAIATAALLIAQFVSVGSEPPPTNAEWVPLRAQLSPAPDVRKSTIYTWIMNSKTGIIYLCESDHLRENSSEPAIDCGQYKLY